MPLNSLILQFLTAIKSPILKLLSGLPIGSHNVNSILQKVSSPITNFWFFIILSFFVWCSWKPLSSKINPKTSINFPIGKSEISSIGIIENFIPPNFPLSGAFSIWHDSLNTKR